MNKEIDNLIREFAKSLAELSSEETVAVSIFVNCEGYTADFKYRDARQLKKRGISMRNLKGEFIK